MQTKDGKYILGKISWRQRKVQEVEEGEKSNKRRELNRESNETSRRSEYKNETGTERNK